ncbi:M4 family metallopeptidase [Pseudoalteromonas sp. SS15]|uniref:M4 family metallopeptidase n=1 Tax=Pseudoalteromonas sp. SS15 TaxID=3139393 RepID=UPI003BAA16CB
MKDYLKPSLFASLFVLAMPATAKEASYHAVPAMMGNAKMGLLCAQAPEFASRDCQTTVIPDHPRTRALFPYIPEQYNLLYRDENSQLFSKYKGYPFVVKHENGVCSLENAAVITRQNTVDYPVYSYACNGEAIESANLAGVLFDYIGRGAFQAENDAHFYAGITMDILHQQFAQMYPDSADACSASADYCLQQLNVVVDGSREPYTSAWDEGRVLLGRGIIGNGIFSDATSLDIIAHETGHALLTWNSEIGYGNGDTSAIQEAFADLTALFVRSEFYKGLQAGDEQNYIESDAYHQLSKDGGAHYVIAWDRYVHNRALRYLYSPRTDGTSIDDWRDIETKTPGPHYKAGILNRFFYRLSISDGWDIAKTFRLTMKAAQSCFTEDTSFEHAAFCLIDVADEQDKARVSAKLQEVGLVPTNSLVNNLDFSIERLYTSINYALAEVEQAELSAVNISLNAQPIYQWQSNFNTQSQFNAIKQAQLNLDAGEHVLAIETTNQEGLTKTGYRLLSIFNQPICQPRTDTVVSNQLTVGTEDFALTQGYEFLTVNEAWYKQALGDFQFHNIPANKVLSVFYDLNRDRQFSDDEKVLSTTELDTAISLPNVDTVPGDMLVRLRIDDSSVSACTANELSQSVDLKVHIEAGKPSTPIEFSYKQVEQTLHLTVLPAYGEQAMFRWILPEQIIEQTDSQLEQDVNAKGAYAISLEHVENDRVISRAEKQIELIADPNLVIECEAQNTKCILQASHAELADPFEYQWVINNESFKKESNAPLEYDFTEYGEFDISLVMSKVDGTAEFSTSKKVSLSQPLPHENITIMARQHNDSVSLSIANADRFGEEYELIWWLDGEKFTARQIEKQLAQLASDYEVKLQIRLAGKVVKEVSHRVYMHADIGLDFKWTNDSSKPLLFSFQSL